MINKFPYADHEEWLKLRSKYIGGSEAGAVVGLDEYKSPYSLWAEKTGKVPPFDGNITTKVGAYLEDLVAQMFEEETGKKVRRNNFMLVNDRYPWAEANVDRLVVGEKALLEIKTTNSLPVMKKVKDGEFPARWWAQVCHYLAVTELEKAYLAVLVNCREFHVFELNRDEAEIEALMEAEKDFWENVTNDTPPEFTGAEADMETVGAIYPGGEDNMVELFGLSTDLACYNELTKQIKALTDQREVHKLRICEAIGNNNGGYIGENTVTWKPQTRSSFQKEAFKKAHPEIDLEPYYSTSTSRVFRVK